ncbi:hypothetical protein D3C76_1050930 [compost metagenome]
MVALDPLMQLSVDAVSRRPEMQGSRAVRKAGEVNSRVIDQQIHIEHEGLVEGFAASKGLDLKSLGQTCYDQTKFRFVDWIEHRRFSTKGTAGDSR